MRSVSIFLAAVLVLTGCVSNQGLKPTFTPSGPPMPPTPPLYIKPQKPVRNIATLASMSPKMLDMQRTLMAAPAPAAPQLAVTYSPLDSSDFLTIRAEGTNVVLSWPTNAWLNGAIPLWRTNVADTNEVWKSVPNVLAHTNADWRTTNVAMFECRLPIRTNETRFFILSTKFSVHIAWNYQTNEVVTGFKLYTGTAPQTYTSVTSYTWQATYKGTENVTNGLFTAWVKGLQTTQTLYLAATAYLTNESSGELESDFSNELTIPAQR